MKVNLTQASLLSNLCSCRGTVGKWIRPHPINRHASTKAVACWGPRRSALALWLRLEAKYERAFGPGATVGVLGMGVPRPACGPWRGSTNGLVRLIFINNHSRPSRGAKPHEADDTRPPQGQPP